MKRCITIFSAVLIFSAVVVERTGMGWRLEQPVAQFLAKKIGKPLPTVTAVVLPWQEGHLVAQDVALALRALVDFHPRVILIGDPLTSFLSTPFSLLKEAQEKGVLRGVPLFFGALSQQKSPVSWFAPSVFLIPEKTSLPKISGDVVSSSHLGFIHASANAQSMPLLAKVSDGKIAASLWWRGLFFSGVKDSSVDAMTFLFLGHFLLLPNNEVLWLDAQASLPSAEYQIPKVAVLDDILLRREEMERGQIRPDFDGLFRKQIVLVGGPMAVAQAKKLQGAEQQLSVRHIGAAPYGALLILLSFGMFLALKYSGIDLALIFLFSVLFYLAAIFLLFRSTGILLPLFMPAAIMIVSGLKKLIPSCPAGREK